MRTLSIIIGLSVMFVFAVASIVQAQDGWEIQLEYVWMDAYGYNEHVGDIVRYTEEFSEDAAGNYTLDYGATYEPINLNLKDKSTLRGELIYRKGQWFLGLSGWTFETDASVSGRITTPEMELTDTGYIYYVNSVRMWDHTIVPVVNELEASGISPVDYWAEDRLQVRTYDLFLGRTLAEKPDSFANFSLGAKFGSLKTRENLGQEQRAFLYDYEGYTFDNHIRLESTAEANLDSMVGPVLGFEGEAKRDKFRIEGFVNHSVLFGKAEYTGLWEDIDDILWIDPVTGETIYHDVYTGEFSFSKDEEVGLPVTELKLEVTYHITDTISIGGGGFYSIWWDAPVAPKWSIPGDWVSDEGTGWRLQERTLIFGGYMVALRVDL